MLNDDSLNRWYDLNNLVSVTKFTNQSENRFLCICVVHNTVTRRQLSGRKPFTPILKQYLNVKYFMTSFPLMKYDYW